MANANIFHLCSSRVRFSKTRKKFDRKGQSVQVSTAKLLASLAGAAGKANPQGSKKCPLQSAYNVTKGEEEFGVEERTLILPPSGMLVQRII